MSLSASLSPVAYVLRLHLEGAYGSPYVASATVVSRGETAEIIGFTSQGPFTRAHRAAVFAALQAAGFLYVEWERRTANGIRLIRNVL